ncbi:hypothetical protein, partial [Salmonella sp. s54395]|uniref:hypothetical protein n=1 Tax=Salmonella sp. s54395 TaxID=3159664 RepID=UPI003981491A
FRAHQEISPIEFKQRQLKVDKTGERFDVTLISTFKIHRFLESRLTVECRVTGQNADLFDLSTKLDLLLTNEAQPTYESTADAGLSSLLWILTTILLIVLLIILGVVIGWKVKRQASRQRREGSSLTEEHIPMISEEWEEKRKTFLKQLKTNYA